MAICGNCGATSARIRTKWRGAVQLPDECPSCAPQSFEKIKSVRDGQISAAWEYDHTRYKMVGGVPQITDEGLQDLEDLATKRSEDEKQAYEAAVEDKRRNRSTRPLTPEEIERYRRMLEPRESRITIQ